MGGKIFEMGIKIREVMIFTISRCYRSVRNHPFLVGMFCLLVLLYRSSPFVFSLLVSASPVLVCTAVLLGTLLSFGQPNIPEIEREEKINHEIASLRTGVLGDAIVVEQNDDYFIERVTHEKGEAVEKLNKELHSVTNGTCELQTGDSVDCITPLSKESFREMKFENDVIERGGKKLDELEYEQKDTIHNERLGGDGAKTDDEDLDLENDKSPAESFDSERVNVDSLDSPPGSPWKHVEEEEEQEEEEDEADDSGSDRAESSSPDASLADIIPMLDELHPLLDEDNPLPVHLSHDVSDAASEHSAKSSDSSSESDDNIEKREDLEVADEDNEDADDDDEPQGSKEGQAKSAITWTEEDQKNLMDLGSSELERNQRLESLIARRRARKTMSMTPERNLIDLESVDLAFNIAPISTARNNPFDLPHDSNDNMGLPPIPGSAPSILSQRQNPFDLPYDSSEEKPDLMRDSFQQEFKAFQAKEPFFRRHESFNVGPSVFGPGRQDRQESRFRPYFVPERSDSEGTSYFPSFERQFSGISDSKASSVPETDSVVSAGDAEDKNLVEEDISYPEELPNSVPEIELRGAAREPEDKNVSEEYVSEEPELMLKKEDRSVSEENIFPGTELISKIEDVSEHVGHGSQSSEEVDSLELDEVEKRDIGTHSENCSEVEEMVVEEGDHDSRVEQDQSDTHLTEDLTKQGYRSASSSSSLSEVSERIFSVREAEDLSAWEESRYDIVEHDEILRQHSLVGSDFVTTSVLAGDTPQKDPVYDTSPPPVRKNLSSSSSMASDVHVESEMGLPPVIIKRTVSFAERESESSDHDREKKIYDKEVSANSTLLYPLDESQSELTEAEFSKHHMKLDSSQAYQVNDTTIAPAVPESSINLASVDSRPSADTSVQGDVVYQHGGHDYLENQISNLVNVDANDAVHGIQHQTVSSVDEDFAQSEELHHTIPTTEDTSTVEHSVDKKVTFQPEQGQTLISNSGIYFEVGHSFEPEEQQISAHGQNTSEGRGSEFEELGFLDKSIDQTSSGNNHEVQELSVIEGIVQEVSARDNTNVSGGQDLEQDVSLNVNSPKSPESITISPEDYESRVTEGYSDVENNTVDETKNAGQLQSLEDRNFLAGAFNPETDKQSTSDVDELKEIDEVLLSELDTVGDFSVKECDSGFDAFEKHVTSGGESSSVPHMMKPIGNAIDDNSNALPERQPIMYLESRLSQFIDFETQAEEVTSVFGPQTSETSAIQHTDISSGDLVQGKIQGSDDRKPTKMVILPSENSRVRQFSNPDINSSMPVVEEVPSIEDIESMFRKVELSVVKKDIMQDGSEMHTEDHINEATSSGMPVLEARSLEDTVSAFKQMSEKETKKPNITVPLQAHGFPEEPNVAGFSYQEQHQNSRLTEPKMELPIVEPELKPGDDDDFDLNEPYEEGYSHMLPGSSDKSLNLVTPTPSELSVIESRPLEEAILTSGSRLEDVLESYSSSRSREVETNEEGTSSHEKLSAKELHAREVNQSDENQDAEIEKPDVQLSTKESHAEQISRSHEDLDAEVENSGLDLTAEELHAEERNKSIGNLDVEVEKVETSTTDIKGKAKKSHKSSSSSSSSSDSSSSDSDKE